MAGSLIKSWTLPHPSLQSCIDRYWWASGPAGSPLPTLLPGTGVDLFFHLDQPFFVATGADGWQPAPQAHLNHMRPGPMRLHAEADYAFVAVRFRSGGLRHLCPALPACGIAEPMPTCALWGRDGIRITDALMQARSATATSAILDTWLLECLQRYGTEDRMIDHAVSRLYYRHADCRIEQLSAAYGLGRRQFERRFKLALGCSPKQFQRLARFQNTMRDLLLHGSHSYMDTALLHGYYDQAHFIHDFRHFTADQPRHFLLAQAPATHFYNPSRHNHP